MSYNLISVGFILEQNLTTKNTKEHKGFSTLLRGS